MWLDLLYFRKLLVKVPHKRMSIEDIFKEKFIIETMRDFVKSRGKPEIIEQFPIKKTHVLEAI